MIRDGDIVSTNKNDTDSVSKEKQISDVKLKTKQDDQQSDILVNGSASTKNDDENEFKADKFKKEIHEIGNVDKTPVQMMTLGSNNNVFMTSQKSQEQPLYTLKKLPKYLKDTLEESLSKISIVEDEDEKIINFIDYETEVHLPDLTALITKDLSEPYSIYTYRYFLHNWPQLSFLAYCKKECVGAIVCKLDQHRKNIWRGYIAMLVVRKDFRRYKIGSKLVQKAIRRMIEQGCDEVVLETEVTNRAALNLYENLGFVRDKRLLRYYLNGVDAWRLKLWLV